MTISKDDVIQAARELFENQPNEFYGGNNIQRDGGGYCSSYVNNKWEMFLECYVVCKNNLAGD